MAAKPTAPAPTDADFAEADDLFGPEGASATDSDFDEADDLLNSVDEDDAEGWVPTERGESVSGVVVKIGQTRSDFPSPGQDPMCPTVTILTKDGTKYRIIGYGSVLRKEMEANMPQVGDLFAVKYWGEKPVRRGPFAGKNYRHFSTAVKRKS
jgi:hypothetical protein